MVDCGEALRSITERAWWRRWLLPSFSDAFFLAILVWLFVAGSSGWKALLMDGDTGWHIRTGEYILDHGSIPRADLFSFTRAGAPWFAWEWLSDVVFGALFRSAGLKGVVLFAGALIAVYATVLLRFAIWRGANVMVALPVTLVAVGSSTIHFLARPHLFTLLLLPLALWALERDRLRADRTIWLLIPLTALWTNMHGGFAVWLALLGLLVAALAVEAWLGRGKWSDVKRYATLLAGCSLATMLNPFGMGLHRHILEYLRSDWIKNLIQEFQAPTFRSEGQMQFEWILILGLLMAARLLMTGKTPEALWIVFLAHSSLISVRHAPLYAAVAGPVLASGLTSLWEQYNKGRAKHSVNGILHQLGDDLRGTFRRTTVWGAVTLGVIANVYSPVAWPKDFPSEAFPVDIIRHHASELMQGRVLTTDQWADYLIFSFYPKQKVFIDGRSDFYGEQLGREYLSLMQGSFTTAKVLRRYGFDLVLIPVDWPLAEMLKHTSGWTVLADDGRAVLFRGKRLPTGVAPNESAAKQPNGKLFESRRTTRRANERENIQSEIEAYTEQ